MYMCLSSMTIELMHYITDTHIQPSHTQDMTYTCDIMHSHWPTNINSTVCAYYYKLKWSLSQCILNIITFPSFKTILIAMDYAMFSMAYTLLLF